jgi:hypothetical protein
MHPPRWLEYTVWAWPNASTPAAPQPEEAEAWRLDIASVLAEKRRSIAAHRSQHGQVIHDDPNAFALDDAMLAHFRRPWELFVKPNDSPT